MCFQCCRVPGTGVLCDKACILESRRTASARRRGLEPTRRRAPAHTLPQHSRQHWHVRQGDVVRQRRPAAAVGRALTMVSDCADQRAHRGTRHAAQRVAAKAALQHTLIELHAFRMPRLMLWWCQDERACRCDWQVACGTATSAVHAAAPLHPATASACTPLVTLITVLADAGAGAGAGVGVGAGAGAGLVRWQALPWCSESVRR